MSPEEFEQRLRKCRLEPGERVLAAVSGGADSVCLLAMLCAVRERYPLEVFCAHAEHGLRGKASLEDEAFVQELCRERNVPFCSEHLDVTGYAKRKGMGIEEAARTLRHAFLRETATRLDCGAVALAHHQRDQAETVLMRAARGTDIRGLCAMRMQQGLLIRPFLEDEPENLRRTLRDLGISWREDVTNGDPAYSRNRVRLRVLPELRRIAPGADRALCRLGMAAQRDEDYFAACLKEMDLVPIPLANGAAVRAAKLRGLQPALRSRALAGLIEAARSTADAQLICEAERLVREGQGSVNLPDGGKLSCGPLWLTAVFQNREVPETPLKTGENETPFGVFSLYPAEQGETGDGKRRQWIPLPLSEKLTVGLRRAGETMVPFGRHRPAELRKLVADAGVEPGLRGSLPVVRAGGSAVWLPGIRASEDCRCGGENAWMLEYRGFCPLE